MARYSDDEQVEQIKDWLKENGKALVAGVIIAVGGVVGWQQWNSYQDRQSEAASMAYLQLLEARQTGSDEDTVARRGQRIMNDYSRTPYAAMAGLQLGEYHADRGNLERAREALEWVADNARESSFKHLGRLRLAQVLIASDRASEAISLLDGADHGEFGAQYQERLGDAYAAQGERERARIAYEAALEFEDLGQSRREYIELKRNDLQSGGNAA
ncbi:MAG: tetratricopeptide repeat protein [Ectothiorhodospiraceae bacterium]|nr:tetratricopeptide repeat protein [Ectothiorhodospiraceae bacterium]MCH8506214.1 tetratricopeptide repeat protein [Ectothiorhodospiraceae bacterium]